ncbi:MAG: ATP-binding protein [Nitrosopumilus sp.]|nr:ATP-binding protein [Nitrosopumilus sp.]
MIHTDQKSQTLTIHSIPDNIHLVERLIDELKKKHDIPEDSYGNMLVAVTEAVTNAIYHGNKADPKRIVNIAYEVGKDKITFIVSDEGTGFDYYNLPDPTAPENLEKPTGRGIFLMKHLADQIIFSDQGKVVELYFNID